MTLSKIGRPFKATTKLHALTFQILIEVCSKPSSLIRNFEFLYKQVAFSLPIICFRIYKHNQILIILTTCDYKHYHQSLPNFSNAHSSHGGVHMGVFIELLEPHVYVDILVAKTSFINRFDPGFHVKK